MELQVSNGAKETPAPAPARKSQVTFDEWLRELTAKGSLDFNTWTSLISKIEETYPDDIEKISSVYDSFLKEFPLCHGYWKNYAIHQARLSTIDNASKIFNRAVQSATYCIDVWVDYCSFAMAACSIPSKVRWLFKRALSFVGKDYSCYLLWDKYAEFESAQQEWGFLAEIYVQRLKFPTEKLHRYYENFKEFVNNVEEDMKTFCVDMESEPIPEGSAVKAKDEVAFVIDRMLDTSTGSFRYNALKKYVSIGDQFYQRACELEREIQKFETMVGMPYFDVKPLDDDQLENWHCYLDFIEIQKDFDWAVKLYERCLISCANYPEFWMRYVEYMEKKGGRELANYALERATTIFLKNVPAIHLFNAQFKERIGDKTSAHAAFIWPDNEPSSCFVDKVVKEANMEKRQGNLKVASSIYEKALKKAERRQKLHDVPTLYLQFSRLKYMMTGSIDAARDVIVDGIGHLPHCKLLFEGLINFLMVHGAQGQVEIVDPIMVVAITPDSGSSQGLCAKDREDISILYLEFLDQCGTIHDISKAWNRHIKLFPHLLRPTLFDTTTSENQSFEVPTKFLGSDQLSGDENLDHLPQPEMLEEAPLLADQPSEVKNNSDHLNHSEMHDERNSSPKDDAIADEVQPEVDKSAREGCEEDKSRLNEATPEASSIEMRTNLTEQVSGENGLGANGEFPEPSTDSLHQHGGEEPTRDSVQEPTRDPVQGLAHEVAEGEVSGASQQNSDSTNLLQEREPVKNSEPISLTNLSLDPKEKDANDNHPATSGSVHSETGFAQNVDESANPPREEAGEGSAKPEDDMLDSTSGFHKDSQDQPQDQQRQVSSEQLPETEMHTNQDDHNPVEQDIHMQDYEKISSARRSSTPDSSPVQNPQQQMIAPAHQPQPSLTHVPSKQEYDQMVSYMQQQQQVMFQQQIYAQQIQQGQQPYYQQQQQQQELQPHQKELLAQLYYQQLPQMQEQQSQLMIQEQQSQLMLQQQQQQQQQEQMYYQYMQQLQGQQGYQQWQLQYQMQQQQLYQLHQQQQLQYPHNQQMIAASGLVPAWSSSFYAQGQEVMAPQQHPQGVAFVATPGPLVQPPHGVASPHASTSP